MRQAEVDFRGPLGENARGALIANLDSSAPGEFDAFVQEGFAELDAADFLAFRAGRFRPDFGRANRLHTHDLPWTTRPRSLQTFLGDQGFIQEGVTAAVDLGYGATASIGLLDGGGLPTDANGAAGDLAGIAHLDWAADLSASTDLKLGASGWSTGSDRQLFGVDLTTRGARGDAQRAWVAGVEAYAANFRDVAGMEDALGGFAWGQFEVVEAVHVGLRFDATQSLAQNDDVTRSTSVWVSHDWSDALRVRVGFEHVDSDIAATDGVNSAFVELSFLFGTHPDEPYWRKPR